MPKVSRTEIFDVSKENFYAVLENYDAYPEFVDGVSGIKVLEKSETEARVEYSVNLIKKFLYILKMKQEKPTHLSWNLESGNLFKKNSGAWYLKDLDDGKIEVTYELEVEFKGFAPKAIINKIVSSNLPAMMKAYYERAKKL
jgi:ribosome-associated toxin RatA of RatAB toxin-antitoxin module